MEERLERPRISIVIPAYNEQARIGNALTEVLRCVHERDWHAEILVVNDGSTRCGRARENSGAISSSAIDRL